MAESTPLRTPPQVGWSLGRFVLWGGFAAIVTPTLLVLTDRVWSREAGTYGPVVLVTGLWLLWREAAELRSRGRPGGVFVAGILLILSLTAFVFGYAFDVSSVLVAGVYGVGASALYSSFGLAALTRLWFPLLYLAFVIPPPGSVLGELTTPLKALVSQAASDVLAGLGLPVSHEGVTIFVAQYQLLVEDACSGMNSIVGLIAVSLLYVYLARGTAVLHSALLIAFIIPIAIMANIVRILILILLTYVGGNDLAQGYLHFTAGMVVFAIALILVFAVDRLLAAIGVVIGRRG